MIVDYATSSCLDAARSLVGLEAFLDGLRVAVLAEHVLRIIRDEGPLIVYTLELHIRSVFGARGLSVTNAEIRTITAHLITNRWLRAGASLEWIRIGPAGPWEWPELLAKFDGRRGLPICAVCRKPVALLEIHYDGALLRPRLGCHGSSEENGVATSMISLAKGFDDYRIAFKPRTD